MYERLLDKTLNPDENALAAYCGDNADSFNELNAYLSNELGLTREIRFPYGSKYGWCVSHRKGKKLICDVFVESGAFTVMARLSAKHIEALYPNVSEYTRGRIDDKYPCGDGGWVNYRVTGDEYMDDVKRLLAVKCGM